MLGDMHVGRELIHRDGWAKLGIELSIELQMTQQVGSQYLALSNHKDKEKMM
jgi:hypothetical protein